VAATARVQPGWHPVGEHVSVAHRRQHFKTQLLAYCFRYGSFDPLTCRYSASGYRAALAEAGLGERVAVDDVTHSVS
jgi:putative salt-induced outer membrane protein YdiY